MKNKMKLTLSFLLLVSTSTLFQGCNKENTIIVGCMAQPGEPILLSIKEDFEAKGYTLKIKTFSDFNTPNMALNEGSIHANLFQHNPFLISYNEANNTHLFCAAKIYDCVYGGYSKKGYTLSTLPEYSTISVANDSSNLKRCLLLLEANQLITLNELPSTLAASNINQYIKTNPKKFQINPIATNMIASSLDDENVSLGIVNATFAIAANLNQSHLLIQEEDPEHLNANILAIRDKDKEEIWVTDLLSLLGSEKTSTYIENTFKGTIHSYFESYIGQ